MPANCLHRNPLLHSGTSQTGRVLNALQPGFAKVDERQASDLILFAKEYARYLHYYNSANETDGDWQPLMRMDVSVVLATLARLPVGTYLQLIRDLLNYLADNDHNDPVQLSTRFSFLFDLVNSWLYETETQCRQLPADWPYKGWLQDTIRSVLAAQRYKLWKWYEVATVENCIAPHEFKPGIPLPFAVENIVLQQKAYWQDCWDYFPDPDLPFEPALYGISVVSKIRSAAVNNLFVGVLENIFQQAASITQRAEESLQQSMLEFPRHTPHYALFLTFTKLFRFAQDELNQFTQRHLELYYRDLLQLIPRGAVGDEAHVIVNLQKQVAQHLVKAGTAFKGGKDKAGNEIWYTASRDVIINKAGVGALQAVLATPGKSGSRSFQSVYAASQVKSADGAGAPIKGDDRSWATFGPVNSDNLATVGFAIASHLLFMQEGERTVTFTFEATQDLPSDTILFQSTNAPTVQLTGEKDWETASLLSFAKDASNPKRFVIKIRVSPDTGAIVPFSAVIHKDVFSTQFPVARFLFKSRQTLNPLFLWSSIQLKKAWMTVEVRDFKKLVLHNEISQLDPSKAFNPFSAQPHSGSTLLVGSKEIFQKDNAAVKLSFEWDKVPQPEGIISHMSWYRSGTPYAGNIYDIRHETFYDYDDYVPRVRVAALSGGKWTAFSAAQNLFTSREMFGDALVDHTRPGDCTSLDDLRSRGLFRYHPEADFREAPPQAINFTVSAEIAPDFTGDTPYAQDTKRGFVKLELNRDLGHKDFVQRFTQLASKQQAPPPDPYTPLAKSLTAEYTVSMFMDFSASSSNAFKSKQWQFFSVHPFGNREEHKALTTDADFSIVPAFEAEGTLFIGLQDALPDTTVHLLMQVSEGSANPLRTKQELQWQYLATNNQWKSFENGMLTDESNGLLRSGIVAVAMPSDIMEAPSLMGGAYKWIKASVQQFSDAICSMLEVEAQAIHVQWKSAANPPVHFSQAAPPATITKLVTADSAIKKITHPYDSFGGRLAETSEQYYQRVSERLRHKNRAITIWDYERIVLDAFPSIYKVKCLNHTMVRMNAQGQESGDNELAPGHVVVVPVPDISKLNSRNPLKPLTPLDTLTAIEGHLKKVTSAHVRLQVRNPVFEEVVIKCDIKFFGNDPAYYHNLLLQELKQFMCPWAYDNSREVEFGGRISKSTLIDFIEERSYVDFLTRFRLFLRINNVTQPQDREEIVASTSRSVLVIAPENLHVLNYQNIQC